MKNRLSIQLCLKNLLTEKKKHDELEKHSSSLTCGRAKMPVRSLALAVEAVIQKTLI